MRVKAKIWKAIGGLMSKTIQHVCPGTQQSLIHPPKVADARAAAAEPAASHPTMNKYKMLTRRNVEIFFSLKYQSLSEFP